MTDEKANHRSRQWFDTPELYGWLRHAALKGQGFREESYQGRPIIGICNTWSELTHCNAHFRQLAEHVKRGVWQAGGFPTEFPVISLGELNMRPTTMLFRNLMSMDVEESIVANPLDGVVLLGGCDKTTPALLMGAASADIPAIMLTGGPQLKAHWRGVELSSCTDCRRYLAKFRAGHITQQQWLDIQDQIIRGPGHCLVMGSASTMACLSEALGMSLPGSATPPAPDSRRWQIAELSGRQIVHQVREDLRPSRIMTRDALENAIRTLHAIGGSTNAIIHLVAIAGRLGIPLPLRRFDELSATTPWILDLKPSGRFSMEEFYYDGGMTVLLRQLSPLLHLDALTVTGRTLGENLDAVADPHHGESIKTLPHPLAPEGGLAVLHGSLAPSGAIIKRSAASPHLLKHQGRAVVFENHDDLLRRIDDPSLDVTPQDVLVMRDAGPLGGPGMPEWGLIPIPQKLLKQGVSDMVRISDARISGTAFGTVVVHVAPEAAAGGPLAAVRDGDMIRLDVDQRRLDLLVGDAELERRLSELTQRDRSPRRGYRWLFAQHVLQADQGCDFDFLRADREGRKLEAPSYEAPTDER